MGYDIKNICCIGAGYVGGPTMAVVADKCPKININVVDNNKERIEKWNCKDLDDLPIFEPGLANIIGRCRNKNLFFSTDIEKHISNADMIFISVNTPTKKKGFGAGRASNLKWIDICSRQIANYAKNFTIVVEKSTLPVKTAQTIKSILDANVSREKRFTKTSKSFSILSNPEFLAEGSAIEDLENPDRILIGGEDEEAINCLKNIYLNWIGEEKILTTDLWSSELSKLIANAFLAQRISSINSISALCEETEANIDNVSKAVGMDSRIGNDFLDSGPGFGGSCFKKDISNLIYICNHYGLNDVAQYWEQVILINDWQQKRISKIIVDKLFGTISDKKITVLGFAFKPNTNDTRESPSINICKSLLEEGGLLSIYDPKVSDNQIKEDLLDVDSLSYTTEKNSLISGKFEIHKDLYEASNGSDAIIILTAWKEFYELDFKKLFKGMRSPCWIFDTKNIVDSNLAKSFGFNVWKLGDGSIS